MTNLDLIKIKKLLEEDKDVLIANGLAYIELAKQMEVLEQENAELRKAIARREIVIRAAERRVYKIARRERRSGYGQNQNA